jgi:hypothetical protein
VLGRRRGLRDELALRAAGAPAPAQLRVVATSLPYLGTRRDQITSAAFRAAGCPSGSEGVESANELVVAGRRNGAGRHRAPAHAGVTPALRNIVSNDRGAEAWPQIGAARRRGGPPLTRPGAALANP